MWPKNKHFFLALSVLIGTIIGAGIFGLPYVISKSGIMPGFFYLLVLGTAVTLIHLFFGEIILRTKTKYRLPGFAQKYLGDKSKILVTIAVFLGVGGALLAYIILAGDFLKILFSPIFELSSFQFSFIFWFILSFFVYRGIKIIAPAELLTNILFFSVIFLIVWFCLPKLNFSGLEIINLPNIFLPYGVILFSLIGWSALPEINELLKTPEEKKDIKKIIILASVIVVAFYLCFTLVLLGAGGKSVSPDVLSGLIPILGKKIIFLGALAGVITLADSFLVLGLYLKNTFTNDLKLSPTTSFFLACGFPFVLYLIGFRNFIETIGFVGAILGILEGIMIILIYKKAKLLGDRIPEYNLKIPSYLPYFLILLFVLGAISQIIL